MSAKRSVEFLKKIADHITSTGNHDKITKVVSFIYLCEKKSKIVDHITMLPLLGRSF